jgi:predicted ATPase
LTSTTIVQALPWIDPSERSPIELLEDAFQDKSALLILDNAEDMRAEVAQIVMRMSKNCPNLNFLIVSREHIGMEGESIMPLRTMEVPNERTPTDEVQDSESVKLFLNRVWLRDEDFRPTDSDLQGIAELMRLTDGLPLAIEIVAAQFQRKSITSLVASLSAKLIALRHESHLPNERHRRFAGVLDWGYERLSKKGKRLLHRLAVFEGSFNTDSVRQICCDDDESPEAGCGIDELIRFSLVAEVPASTSDQEKRYRLLGPTKDYAYEKLTRSGETPQMLFNMLDWAVRLVESKDPEVPRRWFMRISAELPNIERAIDWATAEPDDPRVVVLGYHLFDYWREMNLAEAGLRHMTAMIESTKGLDPKSRMRLLNLRAGLYIDIRQEEHAIADFQSALRLAKKVRDSKSETLIVGNMGIAYGALGDLTKAVDIGSKALEKIEYGGDSWANQAINVIGFLIKLNRLDEAANLLQILRDTDFTQKEFRVDSLYGSLAIANKDFDGAIEFLGRAMLGYWDASSVRMVWDVGARLITAQTGVGLLRHAANYYGCLERYRQTMKLKPAPGVEELLNRSLSELRQKLGVDFELEVSRGSRLDLSDIIAHIRNPLGESGPER